MSTAIIIGLIYNTSEKITGKMLDDTALVGCAAMTGVGAAINNAKVEPGSSVVIIGCGAIGLSINQGAKIAGAEKFFASDMADNKLQMAQHFGATHCVNSMIDDPAIKIQDLITSGADYAFEDMKNNANTHGVIAY